MAHLSFSEIQEPPRDPTSAVGSSSPSMGGDSVPSWKEWRDDLKVDGTDGKQLVVLCGFSLRKASYWYTDKILSIRYRCIIQKEGSF